MKQAQDFERRLAATIRLSRAEAACRHATTEQALERARKERDEIIRQQRNAGLYPRA